jgi:hypothetical protein
MRLPHAVRLAAFSACLAVAVLLLSSAGAGARVARKHLNAIQAENRRDGSAIWTRRLHFRLQAGAPIEGYASEVSVAPRGSILFHVSLKPAGRYRIRIYRLGWYRGLGARLHACLPSCTGSEKGRPQPIPQPDPSTGLIRAAWPVTDRLKLTGRHWTSGYYVAKLVRLTRPKVGWASTIVFIVRNPPREHAKVLVQASASTWEAYDNWGGKSLYTGDPRAVKVSFLRPQSGNQTSFDFEYDLVRFLERRGYDLSYQADVDTDRHPGWLLAHKLVIVAGHSEYWSKAIRDALERARSAGVNLVFTSSNTGYWQTRYEDARRTIVEYRSAGTDPETDPALKTTRFRDLVPPRPECELMGVQFRVGNSLYEDRTHTYTVVATSRRAPWLAHTGLSRGATIPGGVGREWDEVAPGCRVPGHVHRLFHWENGPHSADAVVYTAPSGAHVLSVGSMTFDLKLDRWRFGRRTPLVPDAALQRFIANVVVSFSR